MSVSNINSGIHAGGHASPQKVCDENKRKKPDKQLLHTSMYLRDTFTLHIDRFHNSDPL